MSKAIGLFSADDLPGNAWNDNPFNTAGPGVTVTSTIPVTNNQNSPNNSSNTMLYIAAGLLAIILLTSNKK